MKRWMVKNVLTLIVHYSEVILGPKVQTLNIFHLGRHEINNLIQCTTKPGVVHRKSGKKSVNHTGLGAGG